MLEGSRSRGHEFKPRTSQLFLFVNMKSVCTPTNTPTLSPFILLLSLLSSMHTWATCCCFPRDHACPPSWVFCSLTACKSFPFVGNTTAFVMQGESSYSPNVAVILKSSLFVQRLGPGSDMIGLGSASETISIQRDESLFLFLCLFLSSNSTWI